MTPYLARDARIWCYLTHTYLLEYSRNRWPIPADDEKAVKHIVSHFFTKGVRGFERDIVISFKTVSSYSFTMYSTSENPKV